MSEIDLRPGELTGIVNRDSTEVLKQVVGENDWAQYREIYDQASRCEIVTDYPIQLDFELNASCNLKCPSCPISAEAVNNKGKSTWFDFDFYTEIIKKGVPRGLRSVKLNYVNEPLIRKKDLYKFIDFARQEGVVDVYFSTNAVLLDQHTIDGIIEAGLTRIQISIDATTEETYDQVRPGGSYTKVLENIDLLLNRRSAKNSPTPLVRVNFVPTAQNQHELEDFVTYWKDRVDMVGIQEFIEPPESSLKTEDLRPQTTEDDVPFRCSFPFKQLVINSEKKVLPCCTFWGEKMPVGVLSNSESISEIWNSKKMMELREIHRAGHYWKNEICKMCVNGAQ